MNSDSLYKQLLYDQKKLTALFKDEYPQFTNAIHQYFPSSSFLPAAQMGMIIQYRKYSKRLLYIHVNVQLIVKTGQKELTDADKKLRKCICEFLSCVFKRSGFRRF